MASLVTNAGLANITAAWHAYASRAKYLQWGVGSGQSATSTGLASTSGTTEARTDGTTSQQTTNTTNDTYRISSATGAHAERGQITRAGASLGHGGSAIGEHPARTDIIGDGPGIGRNDTLFD